MSLWQVIRSFQITNKESSFQTAVTRNTMRWFKPRRTSTQPFGKSRKAEAAVPVGLTVGLFDLAQSKPDFPPLLFAQSAEKFAEGGGQFNRAFWSDQSNGLEINTFRKLLVLKPLDGPLFGAGNRAMSAHRGGKASLSPAGRKAQKIRAKSTP